jgi:hypothetical protein
MSCRSPSSPLRGARAVTRQLARRSCSHRRIYAMRRSESVRGGWWLFVHHEGRKMRLTSGGPVVVGSMLPSSGDGNRAVDVSTWVEESCAAQGIPSRLCDPRTLRDVAVLFMIGKTNTTESNLPNRRDSVRVEMVATSHGRTDNDGFQQRADDGTLAYSQKGIPLAS